MTLQEWALLGTTLVAIATALWTAIKTFADRKNGVRSTELTERRDTVADRDSFIDQLQEQLKSANERADAATARALAAEASSSATGTALTKEREYSQLLRDHIYRRREPPPPARPTT